MPVFQYILLVGSVLTGLVIYANSVIIPAPLLFKVSQMSGLPEPYKAPALLAEAAPVIAVPPPVIIASTARPAGVAKKAVSAAGKRKPTQVARQNLPQQHYAAYPQRQSENIW